MRKFLVPNLAYSAILAKATRFFINLLSTLRQFRLNMKKRYLFPIIYLVVVLIAASFGSDGLVTFVLAPTALPMLAAEVYFDIQLSDSVYFHFAAQTIIYFLIGLAWDRFVTQAPRSFSPAPGRKSE